jgi:uncharacterized protein
LLLIEQTWLERPMPFYFCRLNTPRADFAGTMSVEERTLMGAHAAYWRALQEKQTAVLFGPVGDPAGTWGLVVLECADQAEARRLTANDPVALSGKGFGYDVLPILSANLRNSIR